MDHFKLRPRFNNHNLMPTHSTLDNYRILKTLGIGYSGKVKLGQDMGTGNTFALKTLSVAGEPTEQLMAALKHEFNILRDLDHPSIIKMLEMKTGVYTSRKTGVQKSLTYAVVELATGGEIFDVIFHSKGFDENLTRFYFRSLVQSLLYLHESQIAHRDLKPENLLLDSNFRLKVVDFGFATLLKPNAPNKTRLGTEKYMSPELLYHRAYDARKVDVFAAGVILFVFYSGHPPFNQATENDPYYRAFVKSNDKFWDFHSKQNQKRIYTGAFKDLVNSMLSFDPQKRTTFSEIVASSKWYNSQIDDSDALQKVASYMSQMHQIKQQVIKPAKTGDNRDGQEDHELEELHAISLPDLKYKDLTDVTLNSGQLNGLIIKSANKQLLTALVLKKAVEVGGHKNETNKEKLVISFTNEKEQTSVEINFYQLKDDEFEVLITRRAGDYFDFQKIKNQIQESIWNSLVQMEQ